MYVLVSKFIYSVFITVYTYYQKFVMRVFLFLFFLWIHFLFVFKKYSHIVLSFLLKRIFDWRWDLAKEIFTDCKRLKKYYIMFKYYWIMKLSYLYLPTLIFIPFVWIFFNFLLWRLAYTTFGVNFDSFYRMYKRSFCGTFFHILNFYILLVIIFYYQRPAFVWEFVFWLIYIDWYEFFASLFFFVTAYFIFLWIVGIFFKKFLKFLDKKKSKWLNYSFFFHWHALFNAYEIIIPIYNKILSHFISQHIKYLKFEWIMTELVFTDRLLELFRKEDMILEEGYNFFKKNRNN